MLLLQARGRMTASSLADELEVSVRTIYRDMDALGAAGVPVYAEAGPGGGCQLLDGYRSPIGGISRDEAAALLVLGVPEPLREIGLGPAVRAAQRHLRSAAGRTSAPSESDTPPQPSDASSSERPPAMRPSDLPSEVSDVRLHLDLPRWFHGREPVPHLACVAEGVRRTRRVAMRYRK